MGATPYNGTSGAKLDGSVPSSPVQVKRVETCDPSCASERWEPRTMNDPKTFSVTKTDDEWQSSLTPPAYAVLRQHGTEPRGSSSLNKEKRTGEFRCAGCG